MNHPERKQFPSIAHMNVWLRDLFNGRHPYGTMMSDSLPNYKIREARALELYVGWLRETDPTNIYIRGSITSPRRDCIVLEYTLLRGAEIEADEEAKDFVYREDEDNWEQTLIHR